jgi:DNA polymerase-3 subunit epsilon
MSYFVFLDTETTGLPQKGQQPRIVSLTWAACQPDGSFERMVNSIVQPDGFHIPLESTKIHRITHEHAVRMGRRLPDVLTELVQFLKVERRCVLVGHNLDFDRKVVQAEFGRCEIACDLSSHEQICTMQTTASVCRLPRSGGGYKWPTLQELHAALFGGTFEDAHTSKSDVDATIRCFFELRRRGFYQNIHVDLTQPGTANAFVFECNNSTMEACISKALFGARQSWPNDVAEGDICFLYNIDTAELLGVWRAVSKGGVTYDSSAWNGDFRKQCRVARLGSRIVAVRRHDLRCLPCGRIPNQLPHEVGITLTNTFESRLNDSVLA